MKWFRARLFKGDVLFYVTKKRRKGSVLAIRHDGGTRIDADSDIISGYLAFERTDNGRPVLADETRAQAAYQTWVKNNPQYREIDSDFNGSGGPT